MNDGLYGFPQGTGQVAPAVISYCCVQDSKAANTAAGATVADGAFHTRDCQTEQWDPDGIVSLSSNLITLAAGSYYCHIMFLTFLSNQVASRLYNTTDSSVVLLGMTTYGSSTQSVFVPSQIVGGFTIGDNKQLGVQYRAATAKATDGLGTQANMGQNEVYMNAQFWKIA